jgi:chromosome segregation ATPase
MKPQYRAAIRQPLNIAMLIATFLAGLIAAWWLFPIGLALWGFMVWGVATHPVTQLESVQPERPTAVPRFQSSLDRIEDSQRQVLNAIGATKNPIRQALTPLQTEVNGLVDKCHAVAQRAIPLETQRQARAKMDSSLESEIATLDQQLAQFTDDGIKKVLEKSRASLQSQLDKRNVLTAQLDHVEAQLNGVATVLERAAVEIARLQKLAGNTAATRIGELTTEVRQQSTALAELGKTFLPA